MTAEQLAAFRHVCQCRNAEPFVGWQYMQAIRRVQRAFGIFQSERHTSIDWERWERLHTAIFRVSDELKTSDETGG